MKRQKKERISTFVTCLDELGESLEKLKRSHRQILINVEDDGRIISTRSTMFDSAVMFFSEMKQALSSTAN